MDAFEFIDSAPGSVAIVGIKPTRPIPAWVTSRSGPGERSDHGGVLAVEKYIEKPTYDVAATYVESGGYFWNSAYYCFRASTLLGGVPEAEPELVAATGDYLKTGRRCRRTSRHRSRRTRST